MASACDTKRREPDRDDRFVCSQVLWRSMHRSAVRNATTRLRVGRICPADSAGSAGTLALQIHG